MVSPLSDKEALAARDQALQIRNQSAPRTKRIGKHLSKVAAHLSRIGTWLRETGHVDQSIAVDMASSRCREASEKIYQENIRRWGPDPFKWPE